MYSFRKAGNLVRVEVGAPNYARKTYMVMCCFCKAENFVQVEVWAPNKAAVGLWEFNSLSARIRRVRFPFAAPILGPDRICVTLCRLAHGAFDSLRGPPIYSSDGVCIALQDAVCIAV